MTNTRHLDTALSILSSKGSKRAKGTTFTLTATGFSLAPDLYDAVLQGARGKTIREWLDVPWVDIEAQAREHVAKVAGATLTIYKE